MFRNWATVKVLQTEMLILNIRVNVNVEFSIRVLSLIAAVVMWFIWLLVRQHHAQGADVDGLRDLERTPVKPRCSPCPQVDYDAGMFHFRSSAMNGSCEIAVVVA